MNMTVPVQGSGVREGTSWTKTADGRIVDGNAPPPADTGLTVVNDVPAPVTPQPTAAPRKRAEDLSLIEQFHPSLDPAKVALTWDDKTGRVRVAAKAEPAPALPPESETEAGGELPDLGEQHGTIIDAVTAPTQQATGELAEVKSQLKQTSDLLMTLIQAQLGGKSLAEALGQSTPKEPDYSQIDLYEPQTLANFIKEQVQGALAPHQQAMQHVARREEFEYVNLKYGKEPNFNAKAQAAVKLVAENPALSIEKAYDVVTAIQNTLTPPKQAASTANQATRKLTPEQAAVKAAQAARLPGNGGVRGAGAEARPGYIKGLGQIIAYELQRASLGDY